MSSAVDRYLSLLGERDAIEVLQATPASLAEWFELLPTGEIDQPYAPGKWSGRQVLAHLADVELLLSFRLRQLVAVPGVEIQPMDPDSWAKFYHRLEPSLALEAFRATRAWNLAFFASLSLEDWLAEAFHSERGFESVDLMVKTMAGHDINHLLQLGLRPQAPSYRSSFG